MTVVNDGLAEIAKFLAGDSVNQPDYGQYGDDGTAPTASDSALGNAIASSNLVFSSLSRDNLQVTFEHVLDGSTSNGEMLREYGIFRNADSKLFVHITFTELTKTAAIAYTRRLTIKIRRVAV